MEERGYRKPSYYHYLANKLIFGDVNAVTGDNFKIYTYEPHREGLKVREYTSPEKVRRIDLARFCSVRTMNILGNSIAQTVVFYLRLNAEIYKVHDTIFSNNNYLRFDENFKKEARYAIDSVSMLIEALENRSFVNIPMIIYDLPEITQLLILHREKWAKD